MQLSDLIESLGQVYSHIDVEEFSFCSSRREVAVHEAAITAFIDQNKEEFLIARIEAFKSRISFLKECEAQKGQRSIAKLMIDRAQKVAFLTFRLSCETPKGEIFQIYDEDRFLPIPTSEEMSWITSFLRNVALFSAECLHDSSQNREFISRFEALLSVLHRDALIECATSELLQLINYYLIYRELSDDDFRVCFSNRLPESFQSYLCLLEAKEDPCVAIRCVISLFPSKEERDLVISHCVNQLQIPLKKLLSSDTGIFYEDLLRIAETLTYLDGREAKLSSSEMSALIHRSARSLKCLLMSQVNIAAVPDLPVCEKLICSSSQVETIGNLPLCREIDCSHSFLLREIGDLSSCVRMDCANCFLLERLGNLWCCRILDCSNCYRLESIESLPVCEDLLCTDCRSLRRLPEVLPACHTLCFTGSPGIRLIPQLSPTARAIGGRGSFTFVVDVSELKTNPKKYVQKLGNEFLLVGRSMPCILYQSEIGVSPALDLGGVRRDFITRLFESLFLKGDPACFLMRHEDEEGGVFPILHREADAEDEVCLRTLGRLLAFCLIENSDFRTGRVFNSTFFKLLTIPYIDKIFDGGVPFESLPFEKVIIQALLVLKGVDVRVADLAYAEEGALLDGDVFPLAALFLCEESPNFYKLENRKALREVLLSEANYDARIEAAGLIALEMKQVLKEDGWQSFVHQSTIHPEYPSLRIQGELSKESLKRKMQWHLGENEEGARSCEKLAKIKVFLDKWIEAADERCLTKFVRAITGNNTLSASQIHIQVYQRGVDYIPSSHTCFFVLELSLDYPDQETFNAVIEKFLEYSLCDTGFQVI